ncbi:MAG: phosphoribosylaminoimidazolesuccinocarboxamide synthase [Candidatus Aenigmatarchaeota archaeon]
MIDEYIRKNLNNTLNETNFPFGMLYRGKVRDSYVINGNRVIISTDRISAFDRILGTIPLKGQVLNQLSAFWFEKTSGIVNNHMNEIIDPNVMVVKECKTIPIEVVVRAYITGVTKTSLWYNYNLGVRNFCGNALPDGLRKDQKLDKIIITPTTKSHEHDRPISREEIIKEGIISQETFDRMAEMSLALFKFGSRLVSKNGLILVDTKYEFGECDGEIFVIDEVHTPDSSRFWFADSYEELFERGEPQKELDKEYLRRWLANQGFLGDGTPPALSEEVMIEAAKRYIKAFELITGDDFNILYEDIVERITNNLTKAGFYGRI